MADKTGSPNARRALVGLGRNLRIARVKRRMAIGDLAERAGVSARTVMRLERGEDGVGIGTLAMALLVLGEIDRLGELLDPASDDTGLLMDLAALPKRVRRARNTPSGSRNAAAPVSGGSGSDDDDEGVAF